MVYVAALDLNTFVNDIFTQLPDTHRVVVVTGQVCCSRMFPRLQMFAMHSELIDTQEDIGVPIELWNGSSRAANPQATIR